MDEAPAFSSESKGSGSELGGLRRISIAIRKNLTLKVGAG